MSVPMTSDVLAGECFSSRIGIMQGRLSSPIDGRIQAFPVATWQEEFEKAATCRLACIEWIYEASSEGLNPFGSAKGIGEMRRLAQESGVAIRSLCADYLIERPLVRVMPACAQATSDRVLWMLDQCAAAGIGRLVLPFVAANALRTAQEIAVAVKLINSWVPKVEQNGVEIHLETSLGPVEYAELLNRLAHPLIKVNYDIGNSLQFGFNAHDELSTYGNRIGSVHVKDSWRHGTTVPLGTGEADFRFVFGRLAELGYRGDYILQAARAPEVSELVLAKRYRDFVVAFLLAEAPDGVPRR